jgi:hypothetical protein
MKTFNAKYIAGLEALSDTDLREALAGADVQAVDCVNWSSEFPYAPEVSFRLAYSDKALAILFEVKEEHVRAAAMEDNGPVWEDSCVEFFIMTPDSKHYINFEMNCIGTFLGARRTGRHDAVHFDSEKLSEVRRFTSLPHEPIDSRAEGQSWWGVEVIPFDFLGFEGKPASLRTNIYKCGDKCDKVHFLSWSPIGLPSPEFHCPDFFGEIVLG